MATFRDGHLPRYLVIGCINAACGNGTLIVADRLGFGTTAAILTSFAVASPIGYLLHSSVTFRTDLSWRKFAAYIAGLLASMVLSAATIALMHDGVGADMAVAGLVSTVLVFACSYASTRASVTWRARPDPAESR